MTFGRFVLFLFVSARAGRRTRRSQLKQLLSSLFAEEHSRTIRIYYGASYPMKGAVYPPYRCSGLALRLIALCQISIRQRRIVSAYRDANGSPKLAPIRSSFIASNSFRFMFRLTFFSVVTVPHARARTRT